MALRKKNAFLALANSYLIDSPQPSTISYWWNIGSLLGLCLVIQLGTGIFLAMHYSSNLELAFISVEHIMRDVSSGWALRYCHANGAAFFFILIYAHMARGLYYGSYKSPRVALWVIGVIIFLLLIITGFLGFDKHSPKSNHIKTSYNRASPRKLLFNHHQIRSYSTSSRNNDNKNDSAEKLFKELNIKPIMYFDNLDNNENHRSRGLAAQLNNLAGIYMVLNTINNNCYIGSASTNKFLWRLKCHLWYNHPNLGSKIVKQAVNKYGLNNFLFIILEIIDINSKDMKSELIKSENKYINMYLPKYNILKNAYTSLGYKHTEESRKLMKENYSDERREMIGKLNLGKKFTEETLDKMRKAALNRLSHSEESKLKMVSKTHPIIVKQINDTNIGFKFTNLKIAAKALHCSYKTIQRAVRPDNQFIYIPNTLLPNLTEFSLNNQTEGKIKDNYPYEMVIKDKSGLDKSKGYPKYKIINMREDFSN